MRIIVERFKQTYHRLNAHSLELLPDLYGYDVLFQDPFRRISGLTALTGYFRELYREVRFTTFRFEEDIVQDGRAVLTWTMLLTHPKLNGGKVVTVPGSTHIRFGEKVTYHRDYFDAGAMVYEHLPMIGLVIRTIKERI